MGQERTAPFATLEKPPALRVVVTGLAHKASGLSPASFSPPCVTPIFWSKPPFGTSHGTRQIRLILYRGLRAACTTQKSCLSKFPSKTAQRGLVWERGVVSLLWLRKPRTGQHRRSSKTTYIDFSGHSTFLSFKTKKKRGQHELLSLLCLRGILFLHNCLQTTHTRLAVSITTRLSNSYGKMSNMGPV